MKRAVFIGIILVIGTVISQIGGFIIVMGGMFFRYRVFRKAKRPIVLTLSATVCLYLVTVFLITPPIARLFGRVPLPIVATHDRPVAPRSVAYCFLNRHYVSADLYRIVLESSKQLNSAYPGTVVHYLDANFPFWDGFPLIPHLSHKDGKKIDFSFLYHASGSATEYTGSPSPIGYWIYEAPTPGELSPYAEKNCFLRWDFNLIQRYRRDRVLDVPRTREFLSTLLNHPMSEKALLEVHLHKRLGLSSHPKLKFQQCNAARHDDHIHFQIRD